MGDTTLQGLSILKSTWKDTSVTCFVFTAVRNKREKDVSFPFSLRGFFNSFSFLFGFLRVVNQVYWLEVWGCFF